MYILRAAYITSPQVAMSYLHIHIALFPTQHIDIYYIQSSDDLPKKNSVLSG